MNARVDPLRATANAFTEDRNDDLAEMRLVTNLWSVLAHGFGIL